MAEDVTVGHPNRPVRAVLVLVVSLLAGLLCPPSVGDAAGADMAGAHSAGVDMAGAHRVTVDRADPTFSDVTEDHPFFTEIEWGAAEGIITGFPDGTFRPSGQVTRQALAAFLYRLAGEPDFTAPPTPSFSDVGASHPFVTEIEWAAAQGIVQGYPDGTYQPSRSVTRQAHAALLYRLAGEPDFDPGPATFLDVAPTHPFFAEIEWGAANGIITGFPRDRFRPTVVVTRQAAAAFLYRMAHLILVPPFGPERQLSHAEVNQYLGDLVSAAGPDGAVHVLWKESDQLLYRKTDALGNTLVRTVHLGFEPVLSRAYGLSHPALAPLPDGGVVVLWRYQGSTDPGIYAARLDAAGRTVVEPTLLRNGYFSFLRAGADAAGVVHLVAQEDRLSESQSSTITNRIMYLRLDGDLRAVRPWQYLTSRLGSHATVYPELLVAADGTAHVAWFDDRVTGYVPASYLDLFYARISPAGALTGPVQVTDLPGGVYVPSDDDPGDWGPALALAPDGSLRAVWGGAFGRVYLATLSPEGVPQIRNQLLVDDTDPVISGLGHGLAITTHADGDTSIVVGTGASPKLAAFRVDDQGTLQAAPLRMALSAGNWDHPFLTSGGGALQLTANHDLGTGYDRVVQLSTAGTGRPTDRPDLLVDDAHSTNTSTPEPAVVGTTVTLTVEVANAGFVAAPATTAEVRYQGVLVETVSVPALGVEEHATVEAQWTAPLDLEDPEPLIEITLDPEDSVVETTEANNTATHLVPVLLPPEGASVLGVGWDETDDAGHEGIEVVNAFTALLSGTTSEGAPWSTELTASASANRVLFSPVPPGDYQLSATAAGYGSPDTVDITVTRNPLDPYDIGVTPSALPELWFDRWGDLHGQVVTAIGNVGVAGATVTDRTAGRTTTTGADGSFAFDHLAAGVHRLEVEADGRARVLGLGVTVEVGGVVAPTIPMATTTDAYLDVSVSNAAGTPLPAVTVELRDAADTTTLDSCATNTRGVCSFEPTGGQSYRVRAEATGYLPASAGPVAVTAGRTTSVDLGLDLDVGAVTTESTGTLGWSAWAEKFSVPLVGTADYYTFYGNFATAFEVAYQDVGPQRYIQALDVEVKGNPYYLTILLANVGINVGSPIKLPLDLVIPTFSSNVTNVRVDAVRLVDTPSGDVLWPTDGGVPANPVYSHTEDGETNALATQPGVPVFWPDVAVELDVKIGKAIPGEYPGFGPALELGGADTLTITWIPATNETSVRGRS